MMLVHAAAYVLEEQDGDGNDDIVMSYYFRISNTSGTTQLLKLKHIVLLRIIVLLALEIRKTSLSSLMVTALM
jgi:hypothetical protein